MQLATRLNAARALPGCNNARAFSLPRTPVLPARRSLKSTHVARAADAGSEPVYQGRFGAWSVTDADRLEVVGYRLGISVTALAFLFSGAYALLPPDQEGLRGAMQPLLDPVALAGAAGMGASLQLIHIYLAPLKRALQVFWALGTAGAVYLALTQDTPVSLYVYEHPVWIWAVGPLFAALTGMAFKEGLCYGKWEAAGLFGATPLLVGGHLLGIFPENVERGLLASCMVLLGVFAARKYTQAYKDDIGDKSVFEFQKLPVEEQTAILQARGMLDD
ncbi:hypothetical protein HYH03_015288 [Edaphochlamys debaryana]|uniref:Integral membrane protein n=1 Tax=Edaphochlamys debaryana TaxID=47281 RepID=A0A836BRD9_9CHLO|nr:hypothetical protein HYH03_015288 [Edaphochlamys debaryana]|eukprot:KAG2486085.1 hypothetical protein HYH03_015288 [Edaphochlamys debaryana]